MMLSITAPNSGLKAQFRTMPNGEQIEVYTYEGIEYVEGTPADLELSIPKYGITRSFKRRDKVTRANAVCSLHKGYRALRKPRTSCEQCWNAYNLRKGS